MTILQALEGYYHRLAERGAVASPGWSSEKFGWCIEIGADGGLVDVIDLHDTRGRKPKAVLYQVPAAVKRTVGIAPNFLWDKTAYVLGRTAGAGKRTAEEHARFVAFHRLRLTGQTDEGLLALLRFLERWRPEHFDDETRFRPEMLDANVMFRLAGERLFIHQRPAARALVEKGEADGGGETAFCLITGEQAPIARLHPSIKGVEGAQTAGAALVSFNLDAFTSLGKEQGANAPTSEVAAFRYGAALNHLLARDGPNRVRRPIGDATVVFWADASDAEGSHAEAADAAESWFAGVNDPPTDAEEEVKIGRDMDAIAQGRPLADLRPDILPGTRFFVLGLSPNAARLSVRFWLTGAFSEFAGNLAAHYQDLHIEPRPFHWGGAPSVFRLLVRTTALLQDAKNIPPQLAGEVMRAVLTGGRYPQSLLAAVMIRLRAGDDPLSGWHVAVIRAVLRRDHRKDRKKEDVPVSLAPDEPNRAYQLGRLFAVLEAAQRMALGKVNATIRDRYFGAASATPATVFPLLLRGVQNHLARLRKDGKGDWVERDIADILDRLPPDLPRSLPLIEQGRFVVGYYHQRKEQFKGRPDVAATIEDDEGSDQ
ncbi:type I-C CRISPR-associated protein Cas8c/Csd1 [Gluconacetobacter sp. 1b LMG 1731]|uniref:Type I-C CRISPR-associated protein Cas8c/Csd1 n=1 Tax=Gluconacetobacter dulcium TaxID=2729096 RepID=A0A7W4IK18_9PROT|nr:type I-C CRISPR-associated protein Cas8c/Csd1 [Gluconacetobacter dulcium]MBB2164272.1 type I-C CRISPR-associated protein Cas8c/Csd1 [Gluconacetobacter dulcium]MBB2193320.1 type I-C CRISPR-associated protein Cas8c/Csd1 [Gluconacetobacter dulcium]